MDLLDRLDELTAVAAALVVGRALDEIVVREEKHPLAEHLVALVPLAGAEVATRDPIEPSALSLIHI